MNLNCWEFKKCGRESGGCNIDTLGECPATLTYKLNGAHGGKNGGRSCWIIVGTFCKGEVQGSFAQKYKDCRKCDFYELVQREERENFLDHIELLRLLF